MAKQTKPSNDQPGKVKIRVIEFEVEGSDATMQESLKSITAALNRGMTASPPPARAVRYVQSPASSPHDGAEINDSEGEQADSGAEDAEEIAAPVVTKKSTAPRKLPTPKVVEVNFSDVSPTLKAFAAEKKPDNDLRKYLVIAYWYKHNKQISELNADHFFTAYRHLGWTVPRDPGTPIRDLRHKRRTQFGAGKERGYCVINHVGEEVVLQMGKSD